MDPSGHPIADALIGRTIADKFRVEALVGRGAMGAVYRATQLTLKKRVAIKVMNPDRPADGAFAARFKREAKAASRMDHPNSLRVIDVGEDKGLLYIAMEYLEGKDLFKVLKEEFPLGNERVVSILSQTLAALAVAHEMGVIHRDLKPENIMLLAAKDDEGRPFELVKVCDFGIAKILEQAGEEETGVSRAQTQTGTLTAHGMLIGTPEYMSPEQARGEPADARSDLYSLGVILFQLLTGRLPFVAASKIRLVIKHVEEAPPAPSDFDSKIDARLEAACMKALAKRPDERFQTAREMRAALREVLDGRDSMRVMLPSYARHSSSPSMTSTVPPKRAENVTSAPSEASLPLSSSSRKASRDAMHSRPAETVTPAEAADALHEVRKILSERPSGTSSGAATIASAIAAERRSHTSLVVAVVAVIVAVVAVIAAIR